MRSMVAPFLHLLSLVVSEHEGVFNCRTFFTVNSFKGCCGVVVSRTVTLRNNVSALERNMLTVLARDAACDQSSMREYEDDVDDSFTQLACKLLKNQEAFDCFVGICRFCNAQKRRDMGTLKNSNGGGRFSVANCNTKEHTFGMNRVCWMQSGASNRRLKLHCGIKSMKTTLNDTVSPGALEHLFNAAVTRTTSTPTRKAKCMIITVCFNNEERLSAKELVRDFLLPSIFRNIFIDKPLYQPALTAEDESYEYKSPRSIQRLRTFKAAVFAIVASRRFVLSCGSEEISWESAKRAPYTVKTLRHIIDASALLMYGHWLNEASGKTRRVFLETGLRMQQRYTRVIEASRGTT